MSNRGNPFLRALNIARTKHGYSRRGHEVAEYRIWRNMHVRCENPEHKSFPNYGGRGILVCSRWSGHDGFEHFFADMGKRPSPSHSIERKKNDESYSPENCRWATWRDQARNRRSNTFLEHEGRRLSVAEWAEESGIDRHIIYGRLALGWSIERALNTPSLLVAHKPRELREAKIGRLLFLDRVENDKHGKSRWRCRCECGRETVVGASSVLRGTTRSCGCLHLESISKRNRSLNPL
jgi:hypothetical protein